VQSGRSGPRVEEVESRLRGDDVQEILLPNALPNARPGLRSVRRNWGIIRFIVAGGLYLVSALACMYWVYVFCVDNEDSTLFEALFTGVYLAVMGLLVLSIGLFIAYIACSGWTVEQPINTTVPVNRQRVAAPV
jgi:hypothetical protein